MPRSSLSLLVAAVVVFPVACTRGPRQGGSEDAGRDGKAKPAGRSSEVLKARLSAPEPPKEMAAQPGARDLWASLRKAYEKSGYEPLWTRDGKATRQVSALRDAVQRATTEGLDPAHYDLRPAQTLLAAQPEGLFKDANITPEAQIGRAHV